MGHSGSAASRRLAGAAALKVGEDIEHMDEIIRLPQRHKPGDCPALAVADEDALALCVTDEILKMELAGIDPEKRHTAHAEIDLSKYLPCPARMPAGWSKYLILTS